MRACIRCKEKKQKSDVGLVAAEGILCSACSRQWANMKGAAWDAFLNGATGGSTFVVNT